MSFSYQSLEISGYTTGITGSYISTALTFDVSGLSYDGTGFTIDHFRKVTGIAIIGSGLVKEVSGAFSWDSDDNVWRANIVVSGSIGEQATGVVEWYYNDAISDDTGFNLTGIAIFANPNEVAWNQITNTNGSVVNADSQHSHGTYAQQLQDLDDIARTGAFVYTSGYYLSANGYDSFEIIPFPDIGTPIDPTGYETVSGSYIAHILSSIAHHDPSGYETVSGDYLITSGDYVELSGDFASSSSIDPTGYESVSGSWIAASGDLDDYKYVSGRYSLTSGSYNSHKADISAHHIRYTEAEVITTVETSGLIMAKGINMGSNRILALGTGVISTDAMNLGQKYTLEQHDNTYHSTNYAEDADFQTVSGRYALTSGSYNSHIISATAHHDPSGYETVSGGYIAHILSSTAHLDPTGYESVSGSYISHILDSTAHINPTGYESISGDYLITSGTIDDYAYVSGRYTLTSGSYNTHLTTSSAHHSTTGYETISGSYISHIADANAHIVDIIDITRANFSGLTDMSATEATLVKSIDDSGTVWTSGTAQGQFFWDTESNYRWDVNAGAWIEIGSSTFVLPILSGLGDVDLPDTITDGHILVYSTTTGAWTTGEKYSLEEHDNTYHNPNYTVETGFQTVSGDYATTSGTVDDYKYVSGRYVLTSGSYNSHIISATVHHDPSGYETVSGLYISHILNSTAHINPTGYETVSGDYIIASGVWETAKHDRGHQLTALDDHTGAIWKVYYTNATGGLTELGFGTSGYQLTSMGASVAPIWDTAGGAGATDADAIHNNVASEISGITEKTITVAADELIIEDSEASYAKKSVRTTKLLGCNGAYSENLTLRTTTSTTHVKLKEIQALAPIKNLYITWEAYYTSTYTGYNTRVYKNGVYIGGSADGTSSTPVKHAFYYEGEVENGDLIQIYGRAWTAGRSVGVKNMKIGNSWKPNASY